MPKITKRLVDATAPDPLGKRVTIWDSQIIGFGLVVLPSGVKSYVYDYRNQDGRKRRITLCKHGRLTADEAREQALNKQREVSNGSDPLDTKQATSKSLTLNDLFDLYLQSSKFDGKASSTKSLDQGRIKRHLRPLLGKRLAHRITPDEVSRAHADIKSGKTAVTEKTGPRGLARVTGGETAARDTIALLRSIYSWAIAEGLVGVNPASTLKHRRALRIAVSSDFSA